MKQQYRAYLPIGALVRLHDATLAVITGVYTHYYVVETLYTGNTYAPTLAEVELVTYDLQ